MADDDLPFRFCWNISNLFVPRTQLEATFNIETPTLTQWQVTFEPQTRRNDRWPFSFSLTKVRFGEDNDSTVPDQMRVRISANGNTLEDRPEPNFSFSPANQYTYEFAGNLPSTEASYDVTIEIQLSFPHRNFLYPEVFPQENVLWQLAENLAAVLQNRQYSNFSLITRVPNFRRFRVHSYFIHARWSNFFSVHPEQEINDNTVELNISSYILRSIVLYVYSSVLDTDTILENLQYKTELFQVIDRYMIHHLYNVFVVDESRQLRNTAKDLKIYVESFRLDGPPWDDRTFWWTVEPDNVHRLTFRIQFSFLRGVPPFHYSLRSALPCTLFVHLKLELERKPEGERSTFYTVHGRDYTIGPNGMIGSGNCHFEGIEQRLIDEFLRRRGRSRRIQHFIRCTLHISDGTEVIEIRSEGDNGVQDDMEMLLDLSDHMYEMLMSAIDTDWQLSCPDERPEDPNIPYKVFDLHRSIFAARVPRWQAVIENGQEFNDIPATATCNLSSEPFRIVVAYIYSGKLFPIPAHYLEEIHDFAVRGSLSVLMNFAQPRPRNARYL